MHFIGLSPTSAPGLGFRIPNQDATATARGNAFVASADNPSAIYYNPAAITSLPGQNAQIGFHAISVNSEYRSPSGGSEKSEFAIIPVPQMYFTSAIGESPFHYGIGVYAPFGLAMEWPEDTSFRNLAIEGSLSYATINPVIAWQATPTLSLAIGPTLNYSEVELRQGIGLIPGDELSYRGDDTGFGFTAGLRWQFHPKWAFGAKYHSATELNYRGTSRTKPSPPLPSSAGTSATIDYPQFVSFGVSFAPTPNWVVELAADWTDWDTLDTVTFDGTSLGNLPFPLNWESSWLAHLGATRLLGNGWRVSGGYFFSQNSTSEKNFNPIVPDTNLHVASLGFGYSGRRWNCAVSGQLITGDWREVSGSTPTNPLAGQSADGRYKWFNQALNLAVGYRF